MKSNAGRKSRRVALIALNAALYAVFILVTAYITTPFIIQFRSAVIVPAIFAALYGPLIGGFGAALGTFIASIIRYGSPILTIFSGTPGNFVCFYLLGYIARKYSERDRWLLGYIIGSVVGLLAGFTIIALGLYFLAAVVGMKTLLAWTNTSFITMALAFGIVSELPFMLILGPPIIRALKRERLGSGP
ncbi:MAG: hypothetical protein DRJ51_00840 [Thermoprotei archaeon]|nr:MAG: hypothetical protein DRJ51_00840 [Thermoprotei archaeon]RLF03598.1 MAG: hypothetical protein DRJ59_00205 [Thermoprotei archaeon]